jgi:hypothetical protein
MKSRVLLKVEKSREEEIMHTGIPTRQILDEAI